MRETASAPTPGLRLRVLGTPVVELGARQVELRGRLRDFVAILALAKEGRLPTDEIVRDLWEDDEPTTARAIVHNLASKLRRLLDGEKGLLESLGDGYALRVEPEDEVDVWRFAELAEEGRRRQFEGNDVAAIAAFRNAEDLWRGSSRMRFRVFGDSLVEATHLEDELRIIRETRVRLAVGSGDDPSALTELSSLAREDPFNEELRGFLASALGQAGRRAEALAELAVLRSELQKELGIDPSPEIERIERSIKDQTQPRDGDPVQALPSEARVVTVVRARLEAPAGAAASLAGAQAMVARVVNHAGATVRELPGEGVLACWGLDGAAPDHVDLATGSALALLERVADASPLVQVRIGLASGRLLVEGGDPAGALAGAEVVHRAAQLSLLADARTIAADGNVTEALGRRGFIAATSLGDDAFRLEHDRRRVAPSVRLLGREHEMEILDIAWERVTSERRLLSLLVRGAPGVGKTELAQQFAARRPGAEVLRIDCYPHSVGSGVAPIRAALRALDPDDPKVPDASTSSPSRGPDPEDDIEAFLRTVGDASEHSPVLLLVDDLHWADDLLVKTLARVAKSAADSPVLLLALARPEFALDEGSFVPAETVDLAELEDEAANQLMDDVIPEGAGVADRAGLLRYARGNPFVIQQLGRSLARTVEQGSVEGVTEPSLSLGLLFEERMRLLSPGSRSLLELLAVLGRPAKSSWLQAPSPDAGSYDVDARLGDLEREGLVRRDRGGVQLAHDLLGEMVRAATPPDALADLHERIADLLESSLASEPDRDAVVGAHLESAVTVRAGAGLTSESSLRERALATLTNAAHQASRNGDPHAVITLARAACALENVNDVGLAEAGTLLADALVELGRLDDAFDLLRRLRSDSTSSLAIAILDVAAIGSELYWSAEPDYLEGARRRLTDDLRVLRAGGHRFGEVRALLTLAHLRYLSGELRAADQAVAAADELRHGTASPPRDTISPSLIEGAVGLDPALMEGAREAVENTRGITTAEHLGFLAGLEGLRGDEATAARQFRRARAIASREAVSMATSLVEMEAAMLAIRTGQHIRALALLARAEGPLARAGERMNRSTVFALTSRCLTRAGRVEEGLAAAERALALAFNGDVMSQALGASGKGLAMAYLGDAEGALRHATHGVERVASTEFRYITAEARRDLALVYARLGRVDDARSELLQARDIYASNLAVAAAESVDRELATLRA